MSSLLTIPLIVLRRRRAASETSPNSHCGGRRRRMPHRLLHGGRRGYQDIGITGPKAGHLRGIGTLDSRIHRKRRVSTRGAKEMHEKKRREIEAEAMRGDGRYVRRK